MPLKLILPILLISASLGQVSADIYLPSLPAIAQYFDTPVKYAQLSVTLYMVGLGFSQLIYGPLSDAIGRRKPLLIGIAIVFIGSLLCLAAQNIEMLILGRLLQGLGAGAGVSVTRAMGRDIFDGRTIAKIASYLSIGNVAIMAAAPFIGGMIEEYFVWRINFVFLATYAALILLFIFVKLDETNQYKHSDHLRLKQIKLNIKNILTNKHFLAYAIVSTCTYGGVVAWLTAGAVYLQETAGLSAIQFGTLAFVNGGVFACGALFTAKTVMAWGSKKLIRIGLTCMAIASLGLLLDACYDTRHVIPFLIAVFFYTFGTSTIFSNCFALAMEDFAKTAGFSSSVFGSLQIGGAMLTTFIIAYAPDNTTMPLALIFSGTVLISTLMVYLARDKAN